MATILTRWQNFPYQDLENGIRELVRSLHFLDIGTVMSCEGHIRTAWYYSGVYPWPWIIIVTPPKQMAFLQKKLDVWNRLNPQKKWILSVQRIHGSFTPEYVEWMIKNEYPGCQVKALVPGDENTSLDKDILTTIQAQVFELVRCLLN